MSFKIRKLPYLCNIFTLKMTCYCGNLHQVLMCCYSYSDFYSYLFSHHGPRTLDQTLCFLQKREFGVELLLEVLLFQAKGKRVTKKVSEEEETSSGFPILHLSRW